MNPLSTLAVCGMLVALIAIYLHLRLLQGMNESQRQLVELQRQALEQIKRPAPTAAQISETLAAGDPKWRALRAVELEPVPRMWGGPPLSIPGQRPHPMPVCECNGCRTSRGQRPLPTPRAEVGPHSGRAAEWAKRAGVR